MEIYKILELAKNNKWREIIKAIENLPKIDITFEHRNQLARAYNNINDFDEALKILFSRSEEGIIDSYWNYIVAYAYFNKEEFQLALKHFELSQSLGRNDVKEYIDRCKCYFNNKNNEIKITADKYKKFGFNISCITNKENKFNINARSFFKTPNHFWTHLFDSKQIPFEYEGLDWNDSVGIGTFTNWKDLVVIDIDGCDDINFINEILVELDLPKNYEWLVQSGSKNGYHIYYLGDIIDECDEDDVVSAFPPQKEYERYFDKVEFLWETHVVLPPSVHSSGHCYSFVNCKFPTKSPVRIAKKTIYYFIENYLDFKKITTGGTYGEVMTQISSKVDFISDFNEDISKYFLEDVYLIIDIETSGFPKHSDNGIIYPEILQIAWVLTNKNGVILKKSSFIIDTPFIKQNDYSEFVNIDFKTARKVSFSINKILNKLKEDIEISDYVVAHNIEFDLDILEHFYNKIYGVNPFRDKETICTMKQTMNFCKIPYNYGFKYPKLSELYFKLFNYNITNSHNAEIDVMHTLKCFKKLKSIGIL